jgi:CheY-like chemotaxis protein
MGRTDFSKHRVLVVGPKTHTVQLLGSVLGIAGVGRIIQVEDGRRALELLAADHFSAVFFDQKVGPVGGMPFVVAARRDPSLINPMIPIFLLQDRASRRDVEAARDSGVTDVLTLPISPKTLLDKLYVATQQPRSFIVATEFFGPDRRAGARPAYYGSDRRTRKTRKTKVDFTQV